MSKAGTPWGMWKKKIFRGDGKTWFWVGWNKRTVFQKSRFSQVQKQFLKSLLAKFKISLQTDKVTWRLLRSVDVQWWKGAQGMLRSHRPPSPSLTFCPSLSSLCTFLFLGALLSLSLLSAGCLYKSPSAHVCVAACVRSVCARQARGTNECLYSVEATGRRIGGQGLPSPPSNPTSLQRWRERLRDSPPLFPPPPLSFHTSPLSHLFELLEEPPLLSPPTLPSSQKKGWCKVSGERRKKRGGLERAGAGRRPRRERGETVLAVTFMTCVSVQDVRTLELITCALKQRCSHNRIGVTYFFVGKYKHQTPNQ